MARWIRISGLVILTLVFSTWLASAVPAGERATIDPLTAAPSLASELPAAAAQAGLSAVDWASIQRQIAEYEAQNSVGAQPAGAKPAGAQPEGQALHTGLSGDVAALDLREDHKLTASDGAANDYFGTSVAISGDTLVVGAHGADVGRGAAYVFYRHQGGADNWGQVKKLTGTVGSDGAWFGISVAISGDTVLVGAHQDFVRYPFQGSAYVFYRHQGGADNWGQVQKLTASDGGEGDYFGGSVAVSGDIAVVTADSDNVGANSDQGSAYVFYRNQGGPDNWGQVQKLTASDGAAGDAFGNSVAIHGDTAVVGAGRDEVGANSDQGSAYVFARNYGSADNWGQVQKLTASDGDRGDRFGFSAAISGDTVVVGAFLDGVGANSWQGSAYVFYRHQGGTDNWGQVQKLTASDGAAGDEFGYSVAISGDTTVVGACQDDVGANLRQGSAYVFHRHQGGVDSWGQVQKLTASDGAALDWFGASVAISGDTWVVGAVFDDVGANSNQGSAYVFTVVGSYLSVQAIEVTQGIQNLANQVPLVDSKTTWARVYVRATQADQLADARLHGLRNGAPLQGSPLEPAGGKVLARTTGGNRANLNESFYFWIPPLWRHGTVTFRAEVIPEGAPAGPSPANHSSSVTLTFNRREPLCLAMVRVRTHPKTASMNDPGFWDIVGWVERAYPVPAVHVYDTGGTAEELQVCWTGGWIPIPYLCLGPYEMPDDSWKVLLSLKARDIFTADRCQKYYLFGMVDQSHGPGSGGAAIWSVAWGFMNTSPYLSFGTTWYWPHGGSTMAHEIGHNLGRGHVNCGNPAGVDSGYPYPACDIGPNDPTAFFGFDVAKPAVIAPTAAADLMSYGHVQGKPRWPSDYTYRALFNALPSTGAAAASHTVPEAWIQAQELLLATGAITPTQGAAELSVFYRLPQGTVSAQKLAKAAAEQAAGAEATYHLRLLDASGTVLSDQPFALPEVSDDTGPARPFLLLIPYDARTARIVLTEDGTELAARQVSVHSPTVHVLSPNGAEVFSDTLTVRWQASDADADTLLYTIQYSPDQGTSWQALATSYPTVTLTVDTHALSGSQQALIQVIATDGVNTGDDQSDAPFTLLTHRPTSVIESPADGAFFADGQFILIRGNAFDAEDGPLPGESLAWSSERDGALGSGGELAPTTLSRGPHVITLTATDSDGQVGTASVTVFVGHQIHLPMIIKSLTP